MSKNIAKGKLGEDLAVEYIKKKGFKILERNWRYSRYGEIDIIAVDKVSLVFIEVKTRSSTNYGHPIESITSSKMNKIITIAQAYTNQCINKTYSSYRFDAVSIILKNTPEITYFKDIFQF